ncbi:MAG TPA: site-2 protease family protein [Phycisphaerales bacterium]|nr:site-2 protease family protein [Phycisphaerales bacterium]
MSWSVPVARVARIAVRLHLFFILFIAIELFKAGFAATDRGGAATLGVGPTLVLLTCFFWSVLLHEFGHCLASRAGGGEADEIMMWPLGGLASCRPASNWLAHAATAACGPLVNLLILGITIPVLGSATGRWLGVAIPSPFSLSGIEPLRGSWWLMAVYLLGWTNLVLLLFNLLPVFPLDGGRILQALLWPRLGYTAALRAAIRAGYVGGLAILVLGVVRNEVLLLLVALFGLVTCRQEMRRLEWTQETLGFDPGAEWVPEGGLDDPAESARPDPESGRREREARRRAEEAEELDRILLKINERGLSGLTARERRILREATERRRREGEG